MGTPDQPTAKGSVRAPVAVRRDGSGQIFVRPTAHQPPVCVSLATISIPLSAYLPAQATPATDRPHRTGPRTPEPYAVAGHQPFERGTFAVVVSAANHSLSSSSSIVVDTDSPPQDRCGQGETTHPSRSGSRGWVALSEMPRELWSPVDCVVTTTIRALELQAPRRQRW